MKFYALIAFGSASKVEIGFKCYASLALLDVKICIVCRDNVHRL
jgi:hypothetical protein